MATTTATSVLASVVSSATSAAASPTGGSRAPPQGGILEGQLPNHYSASDPIKLFIIQAGIIIIFCRLLHYPLSYLGQPRVIAEVIGGILLGPSVLSRIPGFKDAIFPAASMPVLNNAANLGLILFLFLIALEVDIRMFTSNWRVALSVGLAGMILPFGLGCGVAWGLYNAFHNVETTVPIAFGVYALFIGTALAITAFPVLCRILSELNLLHTDVGVTTLAAGVGNDVVGWILLALCVALVNNGSGLAALWVLLVCVGWVLFLVFAVKPVFHMLLRRSGSIKNGPTQGMVTLTLLLVLTSAWFTGIIGVHPIFGGFLVGLICPHDGGFAIKLTEKIEDLVAALFLPLYFALSGLNTDLGLLNDGKTWGYVVAVIVIAFSGKIIGGTLAARANKLLWRESFTIGVLMSCKGLVELIVLNIGLQAGILSTRTFTIFVVMAVVTTVTTAPLTKWLYPARYQRKVEMWRRGEINWDETPLRSEGSASMSASTQKLVDTRIRRVLVFLRLESLPSMFTFVSLLGEETEGAKNVSETSGIDDGEKPVVIKKRPLEVHALRIHNLTERASSVMKVTELEEITRRDPVVNAFRTFSQLHDVAASGSVVVAPEDAYADTVVSQASNQGSDFVLIPWSEIGSPFETSPQDRFSDRTHLDFIQRALNGAVCTTGIFISNGFSGIAPIQKPAKDLRRTVSNISMRSHKEAAHPPIADKSHHVFIPFIGGADDRAALRFVFLLARNPNVTATIAQLHWDGEDDITEVPAASGPHGSSDPKSAISTEVTAQDATVISTMKKALPANLVSRMTFLDHTVRNKSAALTWVANIAKDVVGQNARNAGDIIVIGRRQAKLAADPSVNDDMVRTVGTLGAKIATSDLKASVLIIQEAEDASGSS